MSAQQRSEDWIVRNWRLDFFTLWIVQFVASAGFMVAGPFVPLYIQELGASGVREAAVWTGIMGALGGITMAISSPIWGAVADRYGRKPMVARATMGAAVFQASLGLAANVPQLIFFRTLQSLVSGVQAACMALAATVVPTASLGLALGALQTASALGSTVGPFVGGWMAAGLGFRPTFFVTGALLFLAGLLTLVAVHEDFVPPAETGERQRVMAGFSDVWRVPHMPGLMVTVAIARAGGSAMTIAIPLVLQEMAGGDPDVSASAGTVIGLTALAMAAGAILWGRLGDKIGQRPVLLVCLVLSAILIVPQALVHSPLQLAVGQMLFTAALAGLLPSATALIGITGPKGRQGVTYGASGTALAIGNALGPTLAATLIGAFGTRALFVGVGVVLFALFAAMARGLRKDLTIASS
jgi:MFS transporter, DHA1 family, multidrug resistance protein